MLERLYLSNGFLDHLMDQDSPYTLECNTALDLFKYQVTSEDSVESESDIKLATYIMCTWKEYMEYPDEYLERSMNKRFYILYDHPLIQRLEFITKLTNNYKYAWSRFDDIGYEVTSRGDKRFSPFFMKVKLINDKLISLEDFYQLVIKGYIEDGYSSWSQVKGLPTKYPVELTESRTYNMYREYLSVRFGLLIELAIIGRSHKFTDMFGTTNNSQARYYCDILNEFNEKSIIVNYESYSKLECKWD